MTPRLRPSHCSAQRDIHPSLSSVARNRLRNDIRFPGAAYKNFLFECQHISLSPSLTLLTLSYLLPSVHHLGPLVSEAARSCLDSLLTKPSLDSFLRGGLCFGAARPLTIGCSAIHAVSKDDMLLSVLSLSSSTAAACDRFHSVTGWRAGFSDSA